MDNKITVQTPGFLALLTLLFIGLKLSDQIDWSWLWVLSPLWIPFALGLSIVAIGIVLGIIFLIGFLLVAAVAAISGR